MDEGVYVLSKDVNNPNADKRYRNTDWAKRQAFRKGDVFVVRSNNRFLIETYDNMLMKNRITGEEFDRLCAEARGRFKLRLARSGGRGALGYRWLKSEPDTAKERALLELLVENLVPMSDAPTNADAIMQHLTEKHGIMQEDQILKILIEGGKLNYGDLDWAFARLAES